MVPSVVFKDSTFLAEVASYLHLQLANYISEEGIFSYIFVWASYYNTGLVAG